MEDLIDVLVVWSPSLPQSMLGDRATSGALDKVPHSLSP
jgi:hypothetical protein